jgi:hypothetical protein
MASEFFPLDPSVESRVASGGDGTVRFPKADGHDEPDRVEPGPSSCPRRPTALVGSLGNAKINGRAAAALIKLKGNRAFASTPSQSRGVEIEFRRCAQISTALPLRFARWS